MGGRLERIGKYLDLLLKDVVLKLKSYIKDTCDVLHKINIIKIEGDLWLVGIYVETLYISIPHATGLQTI